MAPQKLVTAPARAPSLLAAMLLGAAIMGCRTEPAALEPLPPREAENLLAPVLRDGVPVEIQTFSSGDGPLMVERLPGGHLGEESLLIQGEGSFGGTNIGRVELKGTKSYIATAYVDCTEGKALLKLDYYNGKKHLGSTQSMPALRNGWQQLTVLSQRSRFPEATHLVVVAVCRGATKARYDDFALVTD